MEQYIDRSTGAICKVIETNDKFKTVILEFQDGSTRNVDLSTLRKQYINIEKEEN